ncbi:MAG: hypothetical protein WBE44_05830 [Terriglobales bacterium]|jgi:hypothetical protein
MKSPFLCAAVLLACVGCNSSNTPQAVAPQPVPRVFSEADVAKAQEEITHDYQNKGWEVEQVSLIKDSDRHMSGYAKIRKASGIIRPQLTIPGSEMLVNVKFVQ